MEIVEGRMEEQTDAFGHTRRAFVRTLTVHDAQEAEQVLQRLDKALELVGGGNLLCHMEHWAESREDGWSIIIRSRTLPTLRTHLELLRADCAELICLLADPKSAQRELLAFQDSIRMKDKEILELALDLCHSLEQLAKAQLEDSIVSMDTIYQAPGGSWLLGGMELKSEGAVGTVGLAEVLHQLLGGKDGQGEPPLGSPQLRKLVNQACEEKMELAVLRQRLEILNGRTVPVGPATQKELPVTPPIAEKPFDMPQNRQKHNPWQTAANPNEAAPDSKPTLERDWTRTIRKKVHLSTMISAGDGFTAAVRRDGAVFSTRIFAGLAGWTEITSVAVGGSHLLGLRQNGRVRVVGNNFHGQCDVMHWTDIIQITAGMTHSAGLRGDGTVAIAGWINVDEKSDVSQWRDIAAIASGSRHLVGLRKDGTVVADGNLQQGKCDVADWKDMVAVSAGGMHTVGLRADGTVVAVGSNLFGQCNVGGWTDIIAIDAGADHTVGLKADGTVVAVGNFSFGACAVGDWTNMIAISAGWSTTVGLRSDGTLLAKGKNDYGQCDVSHWRGLI